MPSKDPKDQKTKEELQEEFETLMAKAAIKTAIVSFDKGENQKAPEELQEFWRTLNNDTWLTHREKFAKELKTYKNVTVKKILFDLEHYVRDCRKLVPGFQRTKEEILLMVAIGQIKVKDFNENLANLPNNREKLDRKIHKQIKELDWQDDLSLIRLDELTAKLDQPRIKKSEIEDIEAEIAKIENDIASRKTKRDELAIKLVEWKARGNIDIAGDDGKFRLDA
jgi:23S rRNA pseudoU1915 N3-methylase RlmH